MSQATPNYLASEVDGARSCGAGGRFLPENFESRIPRDWVVSVMSFTSSVWWRQRES